MCHDVYHVYLDTQSPTFYFPYQIFPYLLCCWAVLLLQLYCFYVRDYFQFITLHKICDSISFLLQLYFFVFLFCLFCEMVYICKETERNVEPVVLLSVIVHMYKFNVIKILSLHNLPPHLICLYLPFPLSLACLLLIRIFCCCVYQKYAPVFLTDVGIVVDMTAWTSYP